MAVLQKLMLGFADSLAINDFLIDPDSARKEILSAERFYRGDDANYPGYVGTLSDELRDTIFSRLEQIIDYKIKPCATGDMDLSARLSLKGEERLAKSFVHCDPHPYVAILYLTPDEYVPDSIPYGTTIYETRMHGLNTVLYNSLKPSFRKKWTKEEFEPLAEECKKQTFNLPFWRKIDYVEFKYNRLCIIEGQRFHSACPMFFGEKREEGRLTVTFFFELDCL